MEVCGPVKGLGERNEGALGGQGSDLPTYRTPAASFSSVTCTSTSHLTSWTASASTVWRASWPSPLWSCVWAVGVHRGTHTVRTFVFPRNSSFSKTPGQKSKPNLLGKPRTLAIPHRTQKCRVIRPFPLWTCGFVGYDQIPTPLKSLQNEEASWNSS